MLGNIFHICAREWKFVKRDALLCGFGAKPFEHVSRLRQRVDGVTYSYAVSARLCKQIEDTVNDLYAEWFVYRWQVFDVVHRICFKLWLTLIVTALGLTDGSKFAPRFAQMIFICLRMVFIRQATAFLVVGLLLACFLELEFWRERKFRGTNGHSANDLTNLIVGRTKKVPIQMNIRLFKKMYILLVIFLQSMNYCNYCNLCGLNKTPQLYWLRCE